MRHCEPGTAVVLRAGRDGRTVFLIGPTRLSAGVTLVVEAEVAVWGSRDPRNYDVEPGSCGVAGTLGCKPLIIAAEAPRAGLMGEGVVDGRGGTRLLLPDGREGKTWWELGRHQTGAPTLNSPQLVQVRHSNDFTLYRITLRNAPGGHLAAEATQGLTAWGLKIDSKETLASDGIELGPGSTNVSLVEGVLRSGGRNIVLEANERGSVSHVTIHSTTLYNGLGLSFRPYGGPQKAGSGLNAIVVSGLTIDGSAGGLTVSRDAAYTGVVFEEVCMRGVPNPLAISSAGFAEEGAGTASGAIGTPALILRNVHALMVPGVVPVLTLAGVDAAHKLEATLDNVVVDGARASRTTAEHAVLTLRHGNLKLQGQDLRVTGSLRGGTPYPCTDAFLPFPNSDKAPISAELVPVAVTN